MQPLLHRTSIEYYIFWMCVCSLSYPACKAHAPYYIAVYRLSVSTTFFPHYLINQTVSEEKVTERQMCVLISCTTFVRKFLFVRRIERDIIKIYIGLHVKCPFFFFVSCCTETRIFPIDFRKILISNYTSRQSVQWESRCYVRRDRWTEMTKVSPFAILRMRPKNMQFSLSTPWRNVVGSYGIDPLILHFGTRRVWLTSRYGGKKYRYPSNLRLHCSHGRFGRFSGEIHFSAPSWFEIRSLDSVSTELPSTKLSV